MSNIIDLLKNGKINKVTHFYNRTLSIINNNFNNEVRRIIRLRINTRQKQTIIRNIINKYQQIKNNLKIAYDNEINKINTSFLPVINAASNTTETDENITITIAETQVKKALIIGINYTGTSSQLNGCINDAKSIELYLKEKNFTNIKMLTDETDVKPTRVNILNEIKSLLENSNKNDRLFIYYSGHGSYTVDRNGDELDGKDELLVPLDFNYIKDDELKQIIGSYGKPDTNLIALFDCCNSGTALDLKYQILEKLNYDDITENVRNAETPCNTIFISGCRDEQVSLETIINNKVQGLMTWAFLETIKQNNITWRELIKKMREILKQKSHQIPQLSSGKIFNPDTSVVI